MSAHEHLSSQQFFHGTDADLQPGDTLEPASLRFPGARPSHHLWDRVSVTTDPSVAADYGSRVYRVQPEGDLALDPEYSVSKTGWHTPRARVLGEHS